jgi:hypothetical protein
MTLEPRMTGSVTINHRFRGPPESANGGYACGVLGVLMGNPAEVTLRSPPPLDQPIDLVHTGDGTQAVSRGRLIAEAKPASLVIQAPRAPSFEEAARASERYPWRHEHPYPTCFVCGSGRAPGDGLCVYPGAVAGRDVAAAPFVPDATVADESGRLRPEIAWAVLDCPSWFGFQCFNAFDEGLMLLGRLTARIEALPRAGDRCVAAGWFLGREGRKIHCGSSLYAEDGALLAVGRATWIVLP